MRPNRTLPPALSLAVLAALVSGCAEELVDTGSEPIVGEDADTGLAADGNPLADGNTEELDSLVSPTRGRIELTISTTDPLVPDADVALTVHGVAREPIDGGEVVLTLPTRALMDHAGGKKLPDLPVKKRWSLPPMAEGGTWSGSYTVPGEAAGHYQVLVAAHTHGPDGGPYLLDDVPGSAWMHVSETDGRLTRFLEDSVFPGPAAGWPAAGGAWTASRPDSNKTSWDPDSVYVRVVVITDLDWPIQYDLARGTQVRGRLSNYSVEYRRYTPWITVPEDGIVAFACPKKYGEWRLTAVARAPDTDFVQGREWIGSQPASGNYHGEEDLYCGQLVHLAVMEDRYLPWRLLNLAADTLTRHFGYMRPERVEWRVDPYIDGSRYDPALDEIVFGTRFWPTDEGFGWIAAHEYGHAYHHEALGGLGPASCYGGDIHLPSSYRCALREGFASYAGVVGSGGYEECFEHLGTPKAPAEPPWCRSVSHDRRAEVEAWVAALFMDLIDDNDDYRDDDWAELSGRFVARVFRSCEVKQEDWVPFNDEWEDRDDVSDIVWCLEDYIERAYHESDSVFDGIDAPEDVRRHPKDDPPGYSRGDIRLAWLHNLN